MKTMEHEAFCELERHLEGPSWRWTLGQREAAKSSSPFVKADGMLAEVVDCLRLAAQGESASLATARRHPEIVSAVVLWNEDVARAHLQILVLGGCLQTEIAHRLSTSEATIATVESLFFDVRPALDARGWIACAVILPQQRAGNIDFAERLRLAYFGGPTVAQAILDATERLSFAKVEQLFDQTVLLHLKAQEALSIPLKSERNALRFTKLYMEYRLKDKQIELEREKFRHHCERDLARQKVAEEQMKAKAGQDSSCRGNEEAKDLSAA